MADSTKVLCPLFGEIESLIPDDTVIAQAFSHLRTNVEF